MSALHTPGPWEVHGGPNGLPSHIVAPNGSNTAPGAVGTNITRKGCITLPSSEEGRANARLLAAAPDLLEASENALEVLEILDATIKGEDAMDWPTYAAEAMGALKMAIAKAKGEK